MHRPFTVYRRPTTRKKCYVYYMQFRDEDGNRMTAVSSGKTTRAEVQSVCAELVYMGQV
jgi:hypothetical protein